MAEVLARVQFSPIFRNFKSRVEDLRDGITVQGGKILRREVESSIRLRWYESGKTLRSLEEDVVTSSESQRYILTPTATSEGGAPYPLFGEYGTGRRGAATGRPAPRGYRYGDRAGMKARRFSRIAVGIAAPQVEATAKQLVANFTIN